MIEYPDDPFPQPESSQGVVLSALLQGRTLDVGQAFLEWNLPTLPSRVSELRRLGWPIRSDKQPHPRLLGQFISVYFIDRRFRDWYSAGKHPKDYPDKDGRINPQTGRSR